MNGSILIPEKFRLNGKVIEVVLDDIFCATQCCYGEADFSEKSITLCASYGGKKLTKKFKEETFFHELVHMILDSMGKDRLKYDEGFVDLFATRLYEYEKTKQ
jgi:hypothetical protein